MFPELVVTADALAANEGLRGRSNDMKFSGSAA
jgi:hypothetical protein